ncbi:MAG TPA: hypothetical protein VK442_00815, partial [Xanthobacteraceae bacterium]|nr:hypothetical protein [Xanthobacteraceae bacterium]
MSNIVLPFLRSGVCGGSAEVGTVAAIVRIQSSAQRSATAAARSAGIRIAASFLYSPRSPATQQRSTSAAFLEAILFVAAAAAVLANGTE